MTHPVELARQRELEEVNDAFMSGCDYALNAHLPLMPDKWRPTRRYKQAWIDGYLNELRNRLENESRA